mmetsp:Transcript_142379/g.246475  ORF Transcript_142379/g.246475 Transcript_142379/m.246475 type:complete len:96 (-) Transcript_142379:24-311(-)
MDALQRPGSSGMQKQLTTSLSKRMYGHGHGHVDGHGPGHGRGHGLGRGHGRGRCHAARASVLTARSSVPAKSTTGPGLSGLACAFHASPPLPLCS